MNSPGIRKHKFCSHRYVCDCFQTETTQRKISPARRFCDKDNEQLLFVKPKDMPIGASHFKNVEPSREAILPGEFALRTTSGIHVGTIQLEADLQDFCNKYLSTTTARRSKGVFVLSSQTAEIQNVDRILEVSEHEKNITIKRRRFQHHQSLGCRSASGDHIENPQRLSDDDITGVRFSNHIEGSTMAKGEGQMVEESQDPSLRKKDLHIDEFLCGNS